MPSRPQNLYSPISRRAFLKRSGSFAALLSLPNLGQPNPTLQGRISILGTSLGIAREFEIVGRALIGAGLHERPDNRSPLKGRLQPDSVYPILGVSEDGWWYSLPDGYSPRETIQPIEAYKAPESGGKQGFFEVVSPICPLREACVGHTRILARLAFGSMAYVHDTLTDEHGQLWYAVSGSPTGAGLFGWVQAIHLRRWTPEERSALTEPSIWIDIQKQKLTVYDRDQFVGETALHAGPIIPGMARLVPNAPSIWMDHAPHAYPWNMLLMRDIGKPLHMRSATWHNRFGSPGEQRTFIDIPLFAGRWLFSMLRAAPRSGAPVVIE